MVGGDSNVNIVCLIDYKGYRLIAISVLPISKSDIVYGSADGVSWKIFVTRKIS